MQDTRRLGGGISLGLSIQCRQHQSLFWARDSDVLNGTEPYIMACCQQCPEVWPKNCRNPDFVSFRRHFFLGFTAQKSIQAWFGVQRSTFTFRILSFRSCVPLVFNRCRHFNQSQMAQISRLETNTRSTRVPPPWRPIHHYPNSKTCPTMQLRTNPKNLPPYSSSSPANLTTFDPAYLHGSAHPSPSHPLRRPTPYATVQTGAFEASAHSNVKFAMGKYVVFSDGVLAVEQLRQ